jgi:predicted ABC-type ATPase
VPRDKIIARYKRSLDSLFNMASVCHRVYFFDNTDLLVPFAEVTPKGDLDIYEKEYYRVQPEWFRQNVLKKWPANMVGLVN